MSIFRRLFAERRTGAMLDLRSEDEKQKDYTVREVFASANPVKWVEKTRDQWRQFPEQDQDDSSSCVAHSGKKMLGIQHAVNNGSYVRFSATHLYQRRANKPGEGMNGIDAFEILRLQGITLDELVPSEKMTEDQMNNAEIQPHHVKVGEIFKITNHVGIPVGDIETVASVIQTTGKGVMVWFYFTSREWSPEVPVILTDLRGPGDARSLRHSVVAVDAFLYKGEPALLIEDSAHFGGRSRRIITRSFFEKRNFFARYPMNFVFDEPVTVPPTELAYSFPKELVFIPLTPAGEISDPVKHRAQEKDVVALQNILKAEGCMATNISSTGYYGSITAKAVRAFQTKHRIASEAEIAALRGRVVGPKTLEKLNELY